MEDGDLDLRPRGRDENFVGQDLYQFDSTLVVNNVFVIAALVLVLKFGVVEGCSYM